MTERLLIHMGHVENLYDTVDKQIPYTKPKGLWYSLDLIWYIYAEGTEGGINSVDKSSDELNKIYLECDEICRSIYLLNVEYTDLENPNSNKVLKITNSDEFDEFTFKYTTSWAKFGGMKCIDWPRVANDFAGIEIIPFLKNRYNFRNFSEEDIEKYNRQDFTMLDLYSIWYSGWDLPSGCIWKISSIINFERKTIGEIKEIISRR